MSDNKGNQSGFNDFSGADAGGADVGAHDTAREDNFYALQIGHDFTQGLTDDLRTSAAFAFDHPATFVFIAGLCSFSADCANFSHRM